AGGHRQACHDHTRGGGRRRRGCGHGRLGGDRRRGGGGGGLSQCNARGERDEGGGDRGLQRVHLGCSRGLCRLFGLRESLCPQRRLLSLR
ncbi:MAG: hypothetical protein EOP35_00260, partial [Rubrivivax sp.]